MATILNSQKRKCDVISNGAIAELGFINGPVYGCRLTTDTIVRLVSNGRKVYEIDPTNPDKKVLLTVTTCSKPAFNVVTEAPKNENPIVSKPDEIVVSSDDTTDDAHKLFLAAIGKTENEWRQMSKSEKKRIKAQYESDQKKEFVSEQVVEPVSDEVTE